jgi:hypothetical protein
MIYETDAYGCHIIINSLRNNQFHVRISYRVYNTLGEWIANPEWGDIGTGEEMYLFTLKTIARATKINKPIIDIPMLNK